MDVKPEAPGYVHWVTRTLEEEGYETWAVGGAIRNTLLGLPSGDWDLATRAPPKVVRRLFPRTVPVGVEHGTVGILTRDRTLLEVTTFRRDVETFGRHAVVEFADTLEEDLARRDYTVNAVAWHPIREEFRDPFRGREDLEARVLRTVGKAEDRFSEDYLRVLRGLRFSGRFRFQIHEDTWRALCACTGELDVLSPERVREELMKVLAEDARPSGALALYRAAGVLGALFPELAAVEGHARPGRDEDLWVHSLLLTDALSRSRPLRRLVALLQGLGVPEIHGDAPGEEGRLRAQERAAALLIRLRFSNAEIREVSEQVGVGLEPPVGLEEQAALRRWLHMADPDWLSHLARIWLAKARLDRARWGREPDSVLAVLSRLRALIREGVPLKIQDLAVDGRDLIGMGLKPGPHFGELLSFLMERVLDDPSLNRRDRLLALVQERLEGEG